MKQKMKGREGNLRSAFPEMPQECYDALMRTVRSVKEEDPMKKLTLRTALIVTALIVATMAVALAASQLGLKDLLGDSNQYYLPEKAQTVLSETPQKTFDLGPVSITLRETLADGRLVYMNTQAAAKEKKALVMDWTQEMDEVISSEDAKYLGVQEGLTFQEAAQAADVPLYMVRSYLSLENPDCLTGEEMADYVRGEDGVVLSVNMLQTFPDQVGDTLKGSINLTVTQLDAATGNPMADNAWKLEEAIEIPVNGVTAEKTYACPDGMMAGAYTLESISAQQTAAGVYLTATLKAGEAALQDEVWALYDQLQLLDENGQTIPDGISFTGSLVDEAWPTVTLERMVGLDALPQSLMVRFMETSGVAVPVE